MGSPPGLLEVLQSPRIPSPPHFQAPVQSYFPPFILSFSFPLASISLSLRVWGLFLLIPLICAPTLSLFFALFLCISLVCFL